jgi:hypothetical protein
VIVAYIIRAMMEAVSTSEMSVNFYQATGCNITKDSHLHIHRRENLKSLPSGSVNGGRFLYQLQEGVCSAEKVKFHNKQVRSIN